MAAWPHARPPDPEGYAASLGAVLSLYPLGVVQECCDPRTGLAREREFPPTPVSITDWCDRRVKQHQGFVAWAKREAAEMQEEQQFSDEHQLSMIGRLQKFMRGLLDAERQTQPARETAE